MHKLANALPKAFIFSLLLSGININIAQAADASGDVVKNTLVENTILHRTDAIQKVESDNGNIAKPKVAEIKKNNHPNRITSTLKSNTQTGRAFHWFTSDPADNPLVLVSTKADMSQPLAFLATAREVNSHYLQRDAEGYFIYKKTKKINNNNEVIGYFTDKNKTDVKWEPEDEAKNPDESVGIDITAVKETIYDADASGLQPGTLYYYQVGAKNGALSDIGKFKTSGGADKAITFIQYTDTQNAYWNEHKRNEAQFGADTLFQAQKIAPRADFVLHTGDFVEIAEAEDEWLDLMTRSQKGFLQMSLAVVPGNHDEYALDEKELFPKKFNEHFNLDSAGKIDGGSYYSFDYNNAHFIVLNTNDYKNKDKKALGEQQLAWLREDVQKARKNGAKWIILSYHKPLFSKSYHSLEDEDVQNVRDDFMQAIDDLDIDLALQGHDHVFSRTKSLQYAPKTDSFVNAKIDHADFSYDENNHKILQSPKGTTFVIPNTGGTKAYDSLFNESLEHIHKVRPKLNWLTQQQVEHYNNLFEIGYQPQRSARFKNKHENYRDSSEQNFATYTIEGNKLTGAVYQVSGDLSKGEARRVFLVDKFSIVKE
ncbi:purple acid phosphatase family protein [Brenneria tiliae]|uniref:purple acid phosphatase family protein n=1 Tax=Brenneria tiliae TaxID=2914984 RepID=UPI0020149C13|nr:metallophosphoesterase family protein [Brenneria tiliae]MCL2896941.1 metallophosphoesterase family protein [Brenneria tiliae]MCL2901499.1 metallophosphoesterase family protein [Brenneria tiliae]